MSLTAISELSSLDGRIRGGSVKITLSTGIYYARRSKGKPPEWLMAAASSGKIFIWDKYGVRHPEDEFDFGGTPVDAQISNSDPPLIALRSGTTIYVYENGVELFNTGAIANLKGYQIGTSYLVTTTGAANTGTVQFRSIINGSVVDFVSWTIDGGNIGWPEITEAGSIAYVQYRDLSGSRGGHTVKVDPNAILWDQAWLQTGGSTSYLRCSSDGDIILGREHAGGWSNLRVLNGSKTTLDIYQPAATVGYTIGAEPDGAFCAWARHGTTTARIVESDASTHNIVLPSNIASIVRAIECFYGGYTGFLCVDGKIYFYDLDGDLVGAFDTDMYIHEIRGTTELASESLIRLLHKYPRPMKGVKSRLAYEVSS